MNKAVFLDRDGTLIKDKKYACNWNDIEILPGVISGLRRLQAAGYLLIIVTNQSGVARGFFTEKQLNIFNDKLIKMFEIEGIKITDIFYCPHHPQGCVPEYSISCDCRKPKTKLFFDAVEKYKINLNMSYVIGDDIRDCGICYESMCQGIVIGSEYDDRKLLYEKIKFFHTFLQCVDFILG